MLMEKHGAHMIDTATSVSRKMLRAEQAIPDQLSQFLVDLEATQSSVDVWKMIVALGRSVGLPNIDFICANSFANWRKTLFIRTSYDSRWLNDVNQDLDVAKWSYFRSHALEHITPITVGYEFVDSYHKLPESRLEVLREAARRGLRSGFSIPLRQGIPPRAAMISFMGDHPREACEQIINTHGWTLNVAAMNAHQRYMAHFHAEFAERNQITDKQSHLLELIGRGLLDKQIADELNISISAIRQRMETLMRRTGMSNRTELAALAMSMGMLPDPFHGPEGQEYEISIEIDGMPTIEAAE